MAGIVRPHGQLLLRKGRKTGVGVDPDNRRSAGKMIVSHIQPKPTITKSKPNNPNHRVIISTLFGGFNAFLRISGSKRCPHSGHLGSLAPAWRLVWALNTLKGEDERVRIPGFYDEVVGPSERDLTLLAQLPDEAPM
ncbi:MAG: hypothetical protein R3336_07245, partial [Phycisphaeraceae bacterium]|nr:hypothetical protein [Phycisphaeraceae bacterium]